MKQVSITVKKNWMVVCQKLIEQYSTTHKVNKHFNKNATITLYILYNILYSRDKQKALDLKSFGINYQALKRWSSMGNQFCSFIKFLLDKKVIIRWQSQKINPKTNRPYTIYSTEDGINSQYKLNPSILKAFQYDEYISFTVDVSQKNSYFFPTKQSFERKLDSWRYKDDYNDYREPNQYQMMVMNRLNKLTGRINPTFIHGRIYSNDWTNLSKEERKLVRFDGKQIEEVFDIHNCFIQLLANKLQESGAIDIVELDRFSQLAYSGKFYQNIVAGTGIDRNEIKQKVMHFIFSNNWTKKHTIANQKKFVNGVATKRFNQNYIKQWQLVKNYFKTKYPNIFSYMTNYQEIQIDTRKKSKLSVDLQWMQNKYMLNGLMKGLQQKGLIKEPISLHDAIYLTKDQATDEIKQMIEEEWLKIVGYTKPTKKVVQISNERQTIRNWLVETNTTKRMLNWFDNDQELYSMFKLAYQYNV